MVSLFGLHFLVYNTLSSDHIPCHALVPLFGEVPPHVPGGTHETGPGLLGHPLVRARCEGRSIRAGGRIPSHSPLWLQLTLSGANHLLSLCLFLPLRNELDGASQQQLEAGASLVHCTPSTCAPLVSSHRPAFPALTGGPLPLSAQDLWYRLVSTAERVVEAQVPLMVLALKMLRATLCRFSADQVDGPP